MGKKRFNMKARSNSQRIVDDKDTKSIQIEIPGVSREYGGDDEANALVLPSKKRKTKIIKQKQNQITRILSKKQRKLLEKVVDKKKKKEGRAALLEALATVQVHPDELKNYTSISQIQTVGLKNLQKLDLDIKTVNNLHGSSKPFKISSIAGKCKRKRLALLAGYTDAASSDEEMSKKQKKNNVIGFEKDIDDLSSDHDTDIEIENIQTEEQHNNSIKNDIMINEKDKTSEKNISDNNNDNIKNLKSKHVSKVDENLSKPAIYIHVDREPSIQVARLKLPILAEEQQIMETIRENSVIIIAGETGSGKTTQIPQFLYEAGYAENKLIGITEPRRVAAISMSKRVGKEMNLSDKEVSYLIRFEGNVTDNTKIKFMTDGVLLKEIETDFLLKKYSVVILDEAHERTSYTDILIGLLSRIIHVRNKKKDPLKLLIMSATLRVEDFLNNIRLFKIPPPLVKIEARQYPVTIHFQKKTAEDYVKEAFRKVTKIHSKLPEGGILVFLTGQLEVKILCRKLKKAFPIQNKNFKNIKTQKTKNDENGVDELNFDEFDIKRAIKKVKSSKKKLATQITNLPKINLDNYKLPTDDTEADLLENEEKSDIFQSDLEDNETFEEDEDILERTKEPLYVLPLYSLLSSEKQSRVFDPVPEGCRLCVVSTNVAETSLTIPNIKYVVDSGRQKTRLYEKITGVSSFNITFASKASADQRAGRAGRTGPGHCYRLYSSAVFNDEFEDFATPDIQKKPVDDLMLQMKCIGIDKVINFPFPSPPDSVQLEAAEKRLILLGALEETETTTNEKIARVTALGQAISAFPVAPRFGKMLALSHQKNLLSYVVCLVAAFSIQEIFLEITQNLDDSNKDISRWQNKRKAWAGSGHSLLLGDAMTLLKAVGASEYAGSLGKMDCFCLENGLREKAVIEIRKLRIQLTNEINLNLPNCNLSVDPKMKPPTDLQAKYLRQILLSGMGDQVARKVPTEEMSDKNEKRKMKYAYNCGELEEPVFIHSTSVLRKKLPEWVIYQEVYEIQNGDTRKTFMRGVTAIEPEWLLTYVPKACNIINIKEDPIPKYNPVDGKVYCYVEASFGKAGWQLPLSEIEMPLNEKSCRYFGMYFLNGDVFQKLAEYKNKLKTTPSSVTKSWSNLNEYVANFIKCLFSKHVNSKSKLEQIWKENKNYLLEQYTDLLYGIDLGQISLNWPPVENDGE